MPKMTRIPPIVAGSAMLELEAVLVDSRGPEADCGLLPPDLLPGAMLGNAALPELGTSGVTLVGMVVGGATTCWVPAMGLWVVCVPALAVRAVSPAAFEVEAEVWTVGAGCGALDLGICVPATVVAVASPDVDAKATELWFVVPGGAGPDAGAPPDGEGVGAGPTGDDVGVVEVGVGSVGVVTGVELKVVVPGVAGPDVGAPPDGEAVGADPTGDDVGVVEVWVGSIGDATGVGGPVVGAEVVGCGEVGVGVGTGG